MCQRYARSPRLAVLSVFGGLAFAVAVSPAMADAVQKDAQIRELIVLNGAVQSMDELLSPLSEAMMNALKRSGVAITVETRAAVQNATLRVVQQRYDALLDEVVKLYDRAFSEQEIAEILAFSKTATGRRYANAFPALRNRALVLGQQWSKSLQSELRQEVASAVRRAHEQNASTR